MAHEFPNTVLMQPVGTEMVILDTLNGEYYELNEIGCEMVRRLALFRDEEQVIQSLLAEYQVEENCLRADFLDLLENLRRRGLVQVHSAGS